MGRPLPPGPGLRWAGIVAVLLLVLIVVGLFVFFKYVIPRE